MITSDGDDGEGMSVVRRSQWFASVVQDIQQAEDKQVEGDRRQVEEDRPVVQDMQQVEDKQVEGDKLQVEEHRPVVQDIQRVWWL